MNGTNTPVLLVAAMLLGAASPSVAAVGDPPPAKPVVQVERGFETDSSIVLLPTSETGTITVNQCAGCRAQRLSVDGRTRYFAGSQAITLTALKSLVAGHTVLMTVYADRRDPIALRVVAHVAAPPAARR